MLSREQISAVFSQIAQLLQLRGDNPFKIRAYEKAAEIIPTCDDLYEHAAEGTLAEVPGIGKAIAEKTTELLQTGSLPFAEELAAQFPPDILELFEIPGLGAKKIQTLYREKNIGSIAQLHAACTSGALAGLPGFGGKIIPKIESAIAQWQAQRHQFLLPAGIAAAEELLELLREHPDCGRAQVVGELRRNCEILSRIEILATSQNPTALRKTLTEKPSITLREVPNEHTFHLLLDDNIRATITFCTQEQFPLYELALTGSSEHVAALQKIAHQKKWESKTSAPFPSPPEPCATETELYNALDLDFVPPELRESAGIIKRARAHTLPRLVELSNLCGTFHCHTTASDGKSSLEEMALAARDLGLEYLGIADHSRSSAQANGLSEERLLEQIEQIKTLNAQLEGIHLFSGVECDILKNGSLDYPDEVLAQLDYVVGSVHSSMQLPEKEMTARIIRAMENPYITMIGHLTGRLLLRRPGYALDIAAVLDAAARTGTWIELNANPRRLDMDWRWWPQAIEKGVKCVINPDAHHTTGLQNLAFGGRIAAKGGLTKNNVVNCLPLLKISEALNHKKRT